MGLHHNIDGSIPKDYAKLLLKKFKLNSDGWLVTKDKVGDCTGFKTDDFGEIEALSDECSAWAFEDVVNALKEIGPLSDFRIAFDGSASGDPEDAFYALEVKDGQMFEEVVEIIRKPVKSAKPETKRAKANQERIGGEQVMSAKKKDSIGMITGTLVLKVVCEDSGSNSSATVERLLRNIVDHANESGLMSGDSDLTVDRWEASVIKIRKLKTGEA